MPITNDDSRDCLRARSDSIPTDRYGKLSYPFINMGFPKIGSSSLHSFFGCAGYRSAHYRCSSSTKCSECIQQSVREGLQPFHHCIAAEVYSQIDDGRNSFPQIDYLEHILDTYPNATLLLAFRNMDSWYHSLSKWTRNNTNLAQDLVKADIKGLPTGMGNNVHDFSTWFCNHVNRVRDAVSKSPSHTLVEIDLDDEVKTRQFMSNVFDVDASCWGRANANLDLHPELKKENIVTAEGQKKWFLMGDKMIKGKDGIRRKRNYPGQQFLNYQ
ncbi:hypothetical protein ACHAXN_002493 [Cyclotella atomus]